MTTEMTTERKAALAAYVDSALALHGFSLSETARAEVQMNFERSAAIAASFLDLPLSPEDEMAPVFTPVTPSQVTGS